MKIKGLKMHLVDGPTKGLNQASFIPKFIYSEKATKFYEIFPLLLTVCTVVNCKGKISHNFLAFSEYMNFNKTYNGANTIIEMFFLPQSYEFTRYFLQS